MIVSGFESKNKRLEFSKNGIDEDETVTLRGGRKVDNYTSIISYLILSVPAYHI